MPDVLENLVLGLNDDGDSVLLVGGQEIATLAALFEATGKEIANEHIPALARAANHLCRGYSYRLIADAAAFRAAFLDQRKNEDQDAPWQEAVPKLSDFDLPDLDAITDPHIAGNMLAFFVEDDFTGMPYAVDVPLDASDSAAAIYGPVLPRDAA